MMLRWFSNPWASARLDQAREDFRAYHIDEFRFRSVLAMLGYGQHQIEAEVNGELGRMAQ